MTAERINVLGGQHLSPTKTKTKTKTKTVQKPKQCKLCEHRGVIWEFSILSYQFFSKPKTTLKKKPPWSILGKKRKKGITFHPWWLTDDWNRTPWLSRFEFIWQGSMVLHEPETSKRGNAFTEGHVGQNCTAYSEKCHGYINSVWDCNRDEECLGETMHCRSNADES